MTVNELLNSEFIVLPISRNDDDFPEFIRIKLQNYVKIINQLDGRLSTQIKDRVNEITEISYGLIKVSEEYYLGHVYKAYESFKAVMNLVKDYLTIQNRFVLYNKQTDRILEQFYFKARVGTENKFSKSQIFIRPFQDRENIYTYRYSIPGLPCLYLSTNILTAWFELGCPDINTLQIARFIIDKTYKLLYFGDIRKLLEYSEEKEKTNEDQAVINYLTYFPLHAVCTIKTKNKSSIFIPEYIYPQLLMQWLHEEDIEMIEYMSTQIDNNQVNGIDSFQFNNIAIPARSFAKEGNCEILKAHIKVTEPISTKEIINLNSELGHLQKKAKDDMNFYTLFRRQLYLELIKGKSYKYDSSIFGKLEDFLIYEMDPTHIEN